MSERPKFLAAPFPWFGGKSRVADEVWHALGDVAHYVEPFAGSLAVLLARPKGVCATVNDLDCYVANFWRALKHDPEAVGEHASDPVNEADLFARHMWLVTHGRARIDRINADPDFYDAKVAGWWVWGQCIWIGSGWCSGTGPWWSDGQLPHLGDEGRGVNRQLPHLLGNEGQGVNRQRRITDYMCALSRRLEDVRVCCGDWTRVLTDGALSYGSSVGVFLDPPYLGEARTENLYSSDDATVSHAVREWAIANGDDKRLRIVLAGYEAEHAAHMPASWRCHSYRGKRAYGTTAGGGQNEANRQGERLWFSPHCVPEEQPSLFGHDERRGA